MILNNQIDIKHFYRFIEFTSKMLKCKETHERYKLITLDNYTCETKEEILIKDFSDAYLYLLSNLNQVMKEEIIIKSYYLLTGEILGKDICQNILKEYYLNKDSEPYKQAVMVHLTVLENIKKRKFEFALMMSNYIIEKRNGGMMIPYLRIHQSYFNAIKDKNIKKLMWLFSIMENKRKYEITNIILTKEEVIEKLLIEQEILKEKYGVEKLYLYGSYAKNIINEKSDIDLLVVFKPGFINSEKEMKKESIKIYLKEKLEKSIDLIIFEDALTDLDICEMENIITII